jgi:hypothetical protein
MSHPATESKSPKEKKKIKRHPFPFLPSYSPGYLPNQPTPPRGLEEAEDKKNRPSIPSKTEGREEEES